VQNVFIMPDPMAPDDPSAWVAYSTNIYRNDQGICWKILAPAGKATWRATDPFVFTDNAWQAAGGTVPEPNGTEVPPLMVATGPGPNMATAPVRFVYTIHIVVDEVGDVEVNSNVPVDPDVWNQPQP
jgi:hypothetical protein